MSIGVPYPIFGPTIDCPHCRTSIEALILTDSYLCPRHGVFEADPQTHDLIHLQSGRCWRRWADQWFRQHTHADGIRFEIHEELDRLRTRGRRATRVIIADRYQDLLRPYLVDQGPFRRHRDRGQPRLYGLPVFFSSEAFSEADLDPEDTHRWSVINFEVTQDCQQATFQYPPLLSRLAT